MSVTAAVLTVFVVCLFLSVPISVSLLFSALTAAFVNPRLTCDALFAFRTLVTGLDSFVLIAIPLFILSGNLMAKGGISDKLFRLFAFFFGNRTAGMPIAVIISCFFYSMMTGSGAATVAAMGTMTIPLLTRLGYQKSFITALVAVAGGLGVITPPSIPYIVYGQASNTSIGDLFIAGIIPGIIIASFLMIGTFIYCKRSGEDREKLDANYMELKRQGLWKVFKDSFLGLLCPVIILGGIYSGITTPTEAACIAVFYALFVSVFVYKSIRWKEIGKILADSVASLVTMLIIAASATVFARVLAMIQAPQQFAAFILSAISSKIILLLVINAFLLFIGLSIDSVSAILICTPIFMPMISAAGIHPVHFGIIMTANLAIGFVTPPVGVNLFIASSLTGIPAMTIAKHSVKFIVWFFAALMVITFIPAVTLVFVH